MGRWAQRQRTGGGINTPLSITEVVEADTNSLEVLFSGPVDAANFVLMSFLMDPAHISPNAKSQALANSIQLDFASAVGAQTTLTYDGHVANVLTPQSLTITH